MQSRPNGEKVDVITVPIMVNSKPIIAASCGSSWTQVYWVTYLLVHLHFEITFGEFPEKKHFFGPNMETIVRKRTFLFLLYIITACRF